MTTNANVASELFGWKYSSTKSTKHKAIYTGII